jgi:hypothetical protein
MPPERNADPEPLDTTLPAWKAEGGVVEIVYGDESITESIIAAHIARQRGEGDALDGHWMLTRCKVSALIAIMHQRSVVSEWDWALSATVMQVSDNTREMLLNYSRQAARAKIQERALSRAAGEEFIDQRRLDVVKRRVMKVLQDGRISRGDLRARMGKKEYRELLEAATAELADDGLIARVDAPQGGIRFELLPEFTPEPQFSPQNSSSETLNREFTPEPADDIVDLDSRRSLENDGEKLTAREWLANHVAGLQNAGQTTIKSIAVFEAARAAGFKDDNVRLRFDSWLDQQTSDRIVPADVRAAAEAVGYAWMSIRTAACASPRIRSVPARGEAVAERIWLIQRAQDKGTVS